MSARPKTAEHNIETGEVVVREMTDDELAQWQADVIAAKAEADAIDAKELARASALAKLEKLGLTSEEIAALP